MIVGPREMFSTGSQRTDSLNPDDLSPPTALLSLSADWSIGKEYEHFLIAFYSSNVCND